VVEISLAKTKLADIFLLKHGAGTLNLAPRQSVCAFRGIHFLEEHPFVLGFEKREWLVEKGCAFLTERGRIHEYSHLRGMPADTVLSVRFHEALVNCMQEEWPAIRFTRAESFLGLRNDLRFLRWQWTRISNACLELATDEWVMDLIVAAYLSSPRKMSRSFSGAQLGWYAERIEATREALTRRFADQHLLLPLARGVGMSPFHFARIFRELTGFAPHQYLLKVRYREALRMLRDGATVTEACFASGFSNLSHFTRGFRKRFGRRPSSIVARFHSPARVY
jgi:AraC-like DNA-binding protein